jgi:hypothetical protein
MDQEARAIAGDDYEVHHTVSFERHCSMDDQREDPHPWARRRRVHG